jgi:hypothetical protein
MDDWQVNRYEQWGYSWQNQWLSELFSWLHVFLFSGVCENFSKNDIWEGVILAEIRCKILLTLGDRWCLLSPREGLGNCLKMRYWQSRVAVSCWSSTRLKTASDNRPLGDVMDVMYCLSRRWILIRHMHCCSLSATRALRGFNLVDSRRHLSVHTFCWHLIVVMLPTMQQATGLIPGLR